MLYIKALVAVVVVGVGVRIDDEDGASDMDKLHSFEKQIMAQNKHGDGALESKDNVEFKTGMKGQLDKMLNKVKKTHIAAQQTITTSFAAFAVCTSTFVSQNVQSSREEAMFKETKMVTLIAVSWKMENGSKRMNAIKQRRQSEANTPNAQLI